MLTIICGEDIVASREYFRKLKESYYKKNFEIKMIPADELTEIPRWLADSTSLFNERRIYFTERLNKKIAAKSKTAFSAALEWTVKNNELELYVWEELSSRELKTIKGAVTKEFKPSQTIFKLLEACYPSNLSPFLKLIEDVGAQQEEQFIFTMLARHVRNLIIIRSGETIPKLQSWQVAKLKQQANKWSLEKLVGFYEGFHRIDMSIKTSKTPYNLKQSLEILACFYL